MRRLRLLSRILVATTLFPAAALIGTTPVAASPVGTAQSEASTSGTVSKTKHRKKRRTHRRAAAAGTAADSTAPHTETQAALIHTDETGAGQVARARRRTRRRVFYNPWTEPTYADSTVGDNIEGEDLVVRKAAVDALGPYNGTVVVSDPKPVAFSPW